MATRLRPPDEVGSDNARVGNMLIRWWLPVLAPTGSLSVRSDHLHAAVSRWFDQQPDDDGTLARPGHHDADKPYRICGIQQRGSNNVLEVMTLTPDAATLLISQTSKGTVLLLGHLPVRLGAPHPVAMTSWSKLEERTQGRAWELELVSPTTFRTNSINKVLPYPVTVLRGLSNTWNLFSGLDPRGIPREQPDTVWVTRLKTCPCFEQVRSDNWPCITGTVRFECSDPSVAAQVGPLFHLADYAGVGSGRVRGLGRARLRQVWPPTPAKPPLLASAHGQPR